MAELKLNPELIEKACAAVAEFGVTSRGAAAHVGVSGSAFEKWLSHGRSLRDGEALQGRRSEEYRQLVQELVDAWERAEGLLELNLLKSAYDLQKAGNISWRMSMEMLAHRFPAWNPKTRPEEASRPQTVILIGREMLEGERRSPHRAELSSHGVERPLRELEVQPCGQQ